MKFWLTIRINLALKIENVFENNGLKISSVVIFCSYLLHYYNHIIIFIDYERSHQAKQREDIIMR